MFEWSIGNAFTMQVTLYATNITLNSVAKAKFDNVRYCQVGFNWKRKQIAIRPVTKEQIDLNLVDLESLYKFSQGKGYGRIANKDLISLIKANLKKDLDGQKFKASYDNDNNYLIVDLNDESVKG